MNLREMLEEWAHYERDLCAVRGNGSAEIVVDDYYEELEADPISGTCGRSRVEALVFAGVCGAVERRKWEEMRYSFGGEGQDLQLSFRARWVEDKPVYAALIVWTNPPSGEHAIAYGAESTDSYQQGRGGTMLAAYLKLLRHAQYLRSTTGRR